MKIRRAAAESGPPRGSGKLFLAAHHDHQGCVSRGLAQAQKHCQDSGWRLTSTRKQVLELIWAADHTPLKAYDLIELMARSGPRPAPPTVYRALEFLIKAGLIHRLDTLNAYVACREPDGAHIAQFLLCRNCGSVAEIVDTAIAATIGAAAARVGFTLAGYTLEIKGLCPRCAKPAD